jgi:hypothetical protein
LIFVLISRDYGLSDRLIALQLVAKGSRPFAYETKRRRVSVDT